MRISILGSCLAVVLLALPAPERRAEGASDSFALVELFTSEGCSSCPPADRVLAEIARAARHRDQRVYALAFHVDYWNHLGWRDPFGAAAYSDRQREYARVFGKASVYTPQMVVNGTEEFVGSNETRARESVERALERPARVRVTLTAVRLARDGGLEVGYEVSPAVPEAKIGLAVVERGIVRRIGAGENGGRTLKHDEVVRAFRVGPIPRSGRGSERLELPTGLDRDKASLVVFVEAARTMTILGASGADLNRYEVARGLGSGGR